MPPRSKPGQPCCYGNDCRYFRKGQCAFTHETPRTLKKREIKESKEYKAYLEAKEILAKHDAAREALLADEKKAHDTFLRIRMELLRAQDIHRNALANLNSHDEERSKHKFRLEGLQNGITPCKKGKECHLFMNFKPCVYFHTAEEKKHFKVKEQKVLDEIAEQKRLKHNEEVCEKDKEYYRLRYIHLGQALKQALEPRGIIDELSHVIRSYCAERVFKAATPSQNWRLPRILPKALHDCPRCDGCLMFTIAITCGLCGGANPTNILYNRVKDPHSRMLAYAFHPRCSGLLGMACSAEEIATSLRGDVVLYNDKNAEVVHCRYPSNLCFPDKHKKGDGEPIDIPAVVNCWSVGDLEF